ncbi:hypothetical protein HDV00_010539, partial [Rhizophlyctis rosea]
QHIADYIKACSSDRQLHSDFAFLKTSLLPPSQLRGLLAILPSPVARKPNAAAAEAAASEAAKQARLQQEAAERAIVEQPEQQLLEDASLQAPTADFSSSSSITAAASELSQDGQDTILLGITTTTSTGHSLTAGQAPSTPGQDFGRTSTIATPPATPTAGSSVCLSLEEYCLLQGFRAKLQQLRAE